MEQNNTQGQQMDELLLHIFHTSDSNLRYPSPRCFLYNPKNLRRKRKKGNNDGGDIRNCENKVGHQKGHVTQGNNDRIKKGRFHGRGRNYKVGRKKEGHN